MSQSFVKPTNKSISSAVNSPLSSSFTGSLKKMNYTFFKIKQSLDPYSAKSSGKEQFNIERNFVTKFAFATRGGF